MYELGFDDGRAAAEEDMAMYSLENLKLINKSLQESPHFTDTYKAGYAERISNF